MISGFFVISKAQAALSGKDFLFLGPYLNTDKHAY